MHGTFYDFAFKKDSQQLHLFLQTQVRTKVKVNGKHSLTKHSTKFSFVCSIKNPD